VNSESLKNPWNPKSIKTADLQSQTKSENERNSRKSRIPRNLKNLRISWILSAVLIFVDSSRIQNSWDSGTAERIQ
jgi:hypothetical protein